MSDILIVDSKDPLKMLFKLKQIDRIRNYDILASEDPEYIVSKLELKDKLFVESNIINKDKICQNRVELLSQLFLAEARIHDIGFYLKKKQMEAFLNSFIYDIYNIFRAENTDFLLDSVRKIQQEAIRKENLIDRHIERIENYLEKKTIEPNKVTNKEIKELCLEFYNEFIKHKCPKPPKIKILKLGDNVKSLKKNIYNSIVDDFLQFPFENSYYFIYNWYESIIVANVPINYKTSIGGVLADRDFHNFLIQKKNLEKAESKNFLKWYKKSLNVLAINYNKYSNTCYVIKKPDELIINEDDDTIYFRYGQEEFCYQNKVQIPLWLYKTKPEDLKVQDYLLLKNADEKALFVEKFGIDRLINYGTVVDSYENYPDNEMWTKSEYKIIDMSQIIPPRQVVDQWGNKRGKAKPYRYAPFLYMKNQTTGVYHLEGIHPRCKTLYDAIKMRYNGLNIKDYEIKDIK